MANLDLTAILTGAQADQAIIRAAIVKLDSLMADEHLSEAAHAQIKLLLDEYSVWRHVIEGLVSRIEAYQQLGYPDFPAGELLKDLRQEIMDTLQAEEDVINAAQDAIETLFEEPAVDGGALDFAEPVEKR